MDSLLEPRVLMPKVTCIIYSILLQLKPNSITLASSELAPNMFGASSELAPNMFGASSELATVMEFGTN